MIVMQLTAAVVAAMWLVGCGGTSASGAAPARAEAASASHGRCDALEVLRPVLYGDARKELDRLDWTRAQPAEQKDKAVEAFVTEFLSACVADRWSPEEIRCLLDAFRAQETGTQPSCPNSATRRLADREEDVEEATYTRFFGPRPPSGLEKFAEEQERRAADKAACAARSRDPSAPLPDAGHEPRSPIPARYVWLGWFSKAGAPLFDMVTRMPGGAPACVGEVLAGVEGYYMASVIGNTPSLIAVHGMVDRTAAEACIRDIVGRWWPGAQVERSGAITQITAGGGTSYLGWAEDGTVYSNKERAVIEEALADKTTIRSNAPVMALLARVDRCKSTWFVMVADATSKLIGVPSTGVLFASDVLGSGQMFTADTVPRIPLTIELESAAVAKRAVAALGAPHKGLSPALAGQLRKLAPVMRDREVEIDIAPIFSRPELIDEMTAAIARVSAGP